MTNVKNKGLFILSSCLVLFFAACNKGGKTGLLVPKDAGLVVHIDLASLSSKLTWAEIKQTAWFTEALAQTKDSLGRQLLNDPEASGIDPKGGLVFFMRRNGNNGYVAFEGRLKDAALFSKMIETGSKGTVKIEKDGELNVARSSDNESAVLCFNDKLFVAVIDASGLEHKIPGGQHSFENVQKYSPDSLKFFAKNTFQLKGDQLLDADKRFESLITDKADMHYWVNSGNLYGGSLPGMLSMMKFSTLLEGNISTGKANFDNGKITLDALNYYGKELTDLLKKHSGKAIDNETISHLPNQDVLAAFALNYPPDGVRDFLKMLGVDGIANAAMGQLGISAEDFIKANKGSLAFALNDVQVSSTPSAVTLGNGEQIPYEKEHTKLDFVFGSAVGDKASFQKLIDAFNSKMKNQLPGGDSLDNSVKNKLGDQWFALGSTDAATDAFLAGNQKPAYAQSFAGHTFGGYVNLQKAFTTALANNRDSAYKKNLELSAAFWKTATAYSDIRDGQAYSKVEVTLADGSANALKQLNRYVDQMYQALPKKDLREDWPVSVDSLAIPVPEEK
ncbi:DUF4836 family protein [Niabella beijingensis]|uniref:DUF4836 family protein n=1 Tax=Niabella beijingensis TaxID=2872700 RepID=UPI001CBE65A1|nr:DUF4836 family protein [Niabella beijingensis]MBZ4188803.1 DUF4836 family protein [Niabella beijingensis]